MKRTLWINLLLTMLLSFTAGGQDGSEKILLTVGDEKVSRGEFERIYLKNNQMVAETDRKSLEEYLDLFIIYKLKVAEAKANGLDKTEAFKQELNGYRKQLIQPYLTDKETETKLLEEAYERLKYEINASHILISIPEHSTSEDTVLLYDKALKIRERIIIGEPFDVVARATSDDPSVKRNGGQLGYFTAFQMVYPFESAAYSTPVGDISMPTRSRYGYHIVKVNDKRPALGQIKVAHIMVTIPQNAPEEQKLFAKQRIDSIYKLVLQNEDFAKLARLYSQDPNSAKNGGELPYFGSGRMIPEFEKTAFALEKDGDVSEPIQTQYGWHILKRLDKKVIGTYDDMLPEINNRVARDERSRLSIEAFVDKLKDKYGFSMDSAALYTMALLLDDSYYTGTWQKPNTPKMNMFLFKIADQESTLNELADYISQNRVNQAKIPFEIIVNNAFNNLVNEVCINFEEERLLENNPEFSYLLKEYYDGILLFEIMDQSVWTKAANDIEGLTAFYKANIDNYKWGERIHTLQYSTSNETMAKKAQKLASSRKGLRLSNEEFEKQFVENDKPQLTIREKVADHENPDVKGYQSWKNGISKITRNQEGYIFHRFVQITVNEPKPMDEIRGQLIADYQEYLEEEWLKSLREKHPVDVNRKIFEEVAASLN